MTRHSFTAATTVTAVDRIRAHFPALTRTEAAAGGVLRRPRRHAGAAQSVADAVSGYLLEHNANAHWRYPTSMETDAVLVDGRRWLATFLNAEPQEVAFGANMTSLTFHVARSRRRERRPAARRASRDRSPGA